jgi:uncharacterized membrane protein
MNKSSVNKPATSATARPVYRFHWHILFTHFPVSFIIGSFGLISLHFFTETSCFDLAGFISLVAAAIVLLPTTITGWITWKGRYKGLKSKLFSNKIRISVAMIILSLALVTYRGIVYAYNLGPEKAAWHGFYFAGITALFAGAVAEGYFGGRLNHR